jgi:hypothetical protein
VRASERCYSNEIIIDEATRNIVCRVGCTPESRQ